MPPDRVKVVKGPFEFEACHQLINYSGPCENLHGHSYKLHIGISGHLSSADMVVDFKDLKSWVKRCIIDKLDHTNLNESLEIWFPENFNASVHNSSCELMVTIIWNELCARLHELDGHNLRLELVRLYETSTSYAELIRGRD